MSENSTDVEHWILGERSRLLLRDAAIIATALLIVGLCANVVLAYHSRPAFLESKTLQYFVGIIGAVGSVAVIYLWVGMFWHWLKADSYSQKSKIVWFIVLLIGNWVGAIAYYLFVYRRATIHRGIEAHEGN
ncbi:MAG TPA: PLDc N-terminal domain-containing protein [Terriglobales bacterium]|nr:PLDc N-terminal domain-containing protein [Terriglobales bacterium]